MLDALGATATAAWGELGHADDTIGLAREGDEFEFSGAGPLVQAASVGAPTIGTNAPAEVSTGG
jgi:hypothetical protein